MCGITQDLKCHDVVGSAKGKACILCLKKSGKYCIIKARRNGASLQSRGAEEVYRARADNGRENQAERFAFQNNLRSGIYRLRAGFRLCRERREGLSCGLPAVARYPSVMNLIDRFLIDGVWVGHTKAWTIPGTEDLKPYITAKDNPPEIA